MKNYTFNWEIQTLVEQFVSAFNDVIIKKYDKDKNLIIPSDKKVLYMYAPKTRVFNYLNNPAPGGLTLPAISVTINSISRDSSRVFNKIDGFSVSHNNGIETTIHQKKILQPVPINIGISMSIITKYQNDMEQIISNFVPYCDPYIIISWKIPATNQKTPTEIRSEVLWGGDIKINYPTDLQSNQVYRIIADTSFTIKGWIFKKIDDEIIKNIYVINNDFTAVDYKNDLLQNLDDISSEYISVSARPQF